MAKTSIVVIGGGPCGVATARELTLLGYSVTLVEAQKKVGGLASHKEINGNYYEYGTHVFHTDNKRLLEIVRGVMGSELIELPRGSNIHIKFRGRYFNYPLKGPNLITNLPPHVAVLSGLSLAQSMVWYDGILRRKPANTEEYLIQKFGKVLYEAFFRDYSHKVWGIPCSQLDAEFGEQRIPRSDIFSMVKSVIDKLGLGKLLDPHPLSETVIGNIFYCAQGIGLMYERMAEEVLRNQQTVLVGAPLKKLVLEQGRIRSAIVEQDGVRREIEADHFISTIPLPELVEALGDQVPTDVRDAARSLYYRSISLLGILVDKPQVRPAYFTYYQDYTFNRLSEPSNHGLAVSKPGHSVLLAETVCQYNDEAYRGEPAYCAKVLDDLQKEGLVTKSQIIESHPYAWRYAYPVYSVGFRGNLNKIFGFIGSVPNLETTGRQGKFNYVNMHIAVQMGLDTVTKLHERIQKQASKAASSSGATRSEIQPSA